MARFFTISLFLATAPLPAAADVYRCMDAAGVVAYSLEKPAGPCYASPAREKGRAVVAASPGDFPRVDSATQRQRDNDRRRILQAELDDETRLQIEARQIGNAELAAHHGRNVAQLEKELTYAR